MTWKEVVDPLSGSITYVIYDEESKRALIIDANNFELIDKFIMEKKLVIDYIILTHEHYDHVLALAKLQKKYSFQVIASEKCAEELGTNSRRLSRDYSVYIRMKNKTKRNIENGLSNIVINTRFENKMNLNWQGNSLEIFEVNGHSKGSICIIFNQQYLFSGDNLLKDQTSISGFFGGNKNIYMTKTLDFFKSLDDKLMVLPGHGESFKLCEKILEGKQNVEF